MRPPWGGRAHAGPLRVPAVAVLKSNALSDALDLRRGIGVRIVDGDDGLFDGIEELQRGVDELLAQALQDRVGLDGRIHDVIISPG